MVYDPVRYSMKRLSVICVALLLWCCSREEVEKPQPDASGRTTTLTEGRQPVAVESGSERVVTDAPDAGSPPKEISIDSVSVTNPVVVKGHARTFENAVSVRIRGVSGSVVAEEHVTSVGEMGQHNPYTAEIWLTTEPGEAIVVEAFEYSAKDGAVRSLERRHITYAVDRIGVRVTFPMGDCTRFKSWPRHIPKSVAMARLLVEALMQGPTASEKSAGASSPFPQGSEIRSVTLRDGVLKIDFNERLRNVGGSCAALAIRESVTQTLRQLPTVKTVTISAEGSQELALQP